MFAGVGPIIGHASVRSCAVMVIRYPVAVCHACNASADQLERLLVTPLPVLTTGSAGAQTRRTANVVWHEEDRLEIHSHDAEHRGIHDGDWVMLASRAGETSLRALVTERVAPGVIYTTFHHPGTQAKVITTDHSDWATNCPEYKVTAVQFGRSNGPTNWQEQYEEQARASRRIAPVTEAAE
jgi:formate dehydrogenase major subunit